MKTAARKFMKLRIKSSIEHFFAEIQELNLCYFFSTLILTRKNIFGIILHEAACCSSKLRCGWIYEKEEVLYVTASVPHFAHSSANLM
jgi:hypothetical protein